jgi:DNA-binding helix-hairpin-helix protein with protein kinase domain
MEQILYTPSNQQIDLDKKLNSGGEGSIWTVRNQPTLVAKIYHPHTISPEQELKLRDMISNPPEDKMRRVYHHISIAWPVNLLYDQDKFVGFFMPRIPQSPTAIERYNPLIRSQKSPNFNWLSSHRTAKNFAITLEALHKCGHVMGDLNESNILISDNALVTLVRVGLGRRGLRLECNLNVTQKSLGYVWKKSSS